MIEVWILLILLHGEPPAVVEFDSQGSCNVAKTQIERQIEKHRYYQEPVIACFKK